MCTAGRSAEDIVCPAAAAPAAGLVQLLPSAALLLCAFHTCCTERSQRLPLIAPLQA